MFRKLGFPICGMIFLLLTLSACGTAGKSTEAIKITPTSTNFGAPVEKADEIDRAYQVQQLSGPVTHNNTKLEYSQYLSRSITYYGWGKYSPSHDHESKCLCRFNDG